MKLEILINENIIKKSPLLIPIPFKLVHSWLGFK
jgi:hypothetical protein